MYCGGGGGVVQCGVVQCQACPSLYTSPRQQKQEQTTVTITVAPFSVATLWVSQAFLGGATTVYTGKGVHRFGCTQLKVYTA